MLATPTTGPAGLFCPAGLLLGILYYSFLSKSLMSPDRTFPNFFPKCFLSSSPHPDNTHALSALCSIRAPADWRPFLPLSAQEGHRGVSFPLTGPLYNLGPFDLALFVGWSVFDKVLTLAQASLELIHCVAPRG